MIFKVSNLIDDYVGKIRDRYVAYPFAYCRNSFRSNLVVGHIHDELNLLYYVIVEKVDEPFIVFGMNDIPSSAVLEKV